MSILNWCFKQKRGLKLIEPNTNLAEAYLKKSEEAIETMSEISNKGWKISTAYYAMYFSLYSILQKIGVKSEIHKCTILFAQKYLTEYFTTEELEFIEAAMNERIDTQYYTDPQVNQEFYNNLILSAPKFLIKCKSLLPALSEKKINSIRALIIKSN